jgi:hypothetical protein
VASGDLYTSSRRLWSVNLLVGEYERQQVKADMTHTLGS